MDRVTRLGAVLPVVIATLFASGPARSQAPEEGVPRDTEAVDRALELYWRTEQEFDTLVERLHAKPGRNEFTLSLGVVPNDDFYNYMALGIRWDIHVHDQVSLGLNGAATPRFAKELQRFLERPPEYLDRLFATAPPVLVFSAGAQVTWTPLHGKLGMLTAKIAHFDWYLTGGLGVVGTQQRKSGTDEIGVEFAGHLGTGLKFWVVDFMTVGLGYRQFFHTSPDGVGLPAEFALNVGFWTP